jgi:hypothetical protein
MAKRPTNTIRTTSRSPMARDAITLERATAFCPNEGVAASIARRFALEPVDYAAVREIHEEAIGRMANAFGDTLGERATAMHFQRLVGALVTSAFNAGRFYSEKVTEARTLTAKLANDARDEDREGVWGFDSKAQRARHFAAQMGLQAYAQLAAAEGAVDAYGAIIGETWKPYVAPADNAQPLDQQAAAAELEAFGA